MYGKIPDISTSLTPARATRFTHSPPPRERKFSIYFLGGGTGPGQEPVLDTAAQFFKAVS
jgi:hypothetical protein